MFRLNFLGTRGEIEEKDEQHKFHSGVLASMDGIDLLFDVGEENFLEKRPRAILLTHAHPDHSKGLKEGTAIPVHLSRTTAKLLGEYPMEHLEFFANWIPFNIGGVEIKPYPVHHSLKAPAHAFLIRWKDIRVFYAPDFIALRDKDYKKELKNLDVWIGDSSSLRRPLIRRKDREIFGHSPVIRQIKMAKAVGVKLFIVTHLGKEAVEMDERKLEKEIQSMAKEVGIPKVIVAKDGLVVDLVKELKGLSAELEVPKEYLLPGVEADIKNKTRRWRELIATLRYFGNSAYPRIWDEGKSWGKFTPDAKGKDALARYFARIVDVLRSMYFPIIPPEKGEEGYDTSYWKLYRLAEKYMKTKPPAEEEVRKWDERRQRIIELQEEPVITTEDIKAIVPVIVAPEVTAKHALILVHPHALWIAQNKKRAIVKSPHGARMLEEYIGEPLYLAEQDRIYGIIRLHRPREISLEDFAKLRDYHLVSEEERLKWWKGERTLYYFEFERLVIFKRPKRFKRKVGPQVIQRDVVFLEAEEDLEVKVPEEILTDLQIRSLTDEELKAYRDFLRRAYEERRFMRVILAKTNALVLDEMKRREIKFTLKGPLDMESLKFMKEYPEPLEEKGDIKLQEIISAFPPLITIEEDPAQIYLVGRAVNQGICPEGHDIDIVIKQRYPDPRVISAFRKEVGKRNPRVAEKLHFVFDAEGPMVGHSVPIYRLAYKKIGEELQKKFRWQYGKSLGFMKPKKVVEFVHRLESIWEDWAKERIEEGIGVEAKYDGLAFQVHKKGNKVWLLTEDVKIERAEYIPRSVAELKKLKNDFIIQAELIWYKDETLKEPHLRREMVKFVTAKEPLDDSLVVFQCWDILVFNDKEVWNLPWRKRKEVLFKAIPKGLRHWRAIPHEVATTRAALFKLIRKYASQTDADGAMLKAVNHKYLVHPEGEVTRTAEVSKFKNLKEIDVIVYDIHQVVREGVPQKIWNYLAAVGPLTKEEQARVQEKAKVKIKGKIYAKIGITYNYGVKLKIGDILTVAPIMITIEKDEEGKIAPAWMFPEVITHRPEKKQPDSLSFAIQISKLGRAPHPEAFEELALFIFLDDCPHQNNIEICPLRIRFGFKPMEVFEGDEEPPPKDKSPNIYAQYLKFPVRCPYAWKYKCAFVKPYYYGWRLWIPDKPRGMLEQVKEGE